LEYFSLVASLHAQSLTQIKKYIACSKHSNFDNRACSKDMFKRQSLLFQSFFSTKCAPFLLKIGEDFNIASN
jgi:hypothetical protein